MNLVPQIPIYATQALTTITTHREDDIIPTESNDADEDLESILNGFMDNNIRYIPQTNTPQYQIPNYDKNIRPGKSLGKHQFIDKLKHFFIISISGKPIYSLHGNDEMILGYSGLITTIISSFQQQLADEIKSVDFNDTKITFLVRDPLVFVSITKIEYEMALDQNNNLRQLLVNQLEMLYNYLVSIISKPSLCKYYENRMNYDLRKVLTLLDYRNLDDLAMSSTFGFYLNDTAPQLDLGFEYYISNLVDNGFPSFKLSHSIRSKLGNILANERINELLFGVLTYDLRYVLSVLKPKTHNLGNQDLQLLLRIVRNNNSNIKDMEQEDLWLPICLPGFNSNGFLYCYVKSLNLSNLLKLDGLYYDAVKPLNILLLSTNKNNFYGFKQCSDKIIEGIIELDCKQKFYEELNHPITLQMISNNNIGILHFIFKDKARNQFIMSKNGFKQKEDVLKYVYYYTNLYNCKCSTIQNLTGENNNKKLSFVRYDNIVGMMISDDVYEFYCLGNTELNNLIVQSIEIIKWCKKNDKRLFHYTIKFNF